jgi:hypothetical protein
MYYLLPATTEKKDKERKTKKGVGKREFDLSVFVVWRLLQYI